MKRFALLTLMGAVLVGCVASEPAPSGDRVQATETIVLATGPDPRIGNSFAFVEAAIAPSAELLSDSLGFTVPPLQIFLSADADWLTDQYLDAFNLGPGFRPGKIEAFSSCNPQAEAGLGAIFLCEDDPLYQNRGRVLHVVAHEIWHSAVQYGIAQRPCCTDSDFVRGPVPDGIVFYGPHWLLEGSAEMFGTYASLNGNQAQFDREMQRQIGRIPSDIDITRLASRGGFNANDGWNVSPGAAYVLTGGDFAPFGAYFAEIGRGVPYPRAFESAFGMDEATFASALRDTLRES